MTSHGCGIVHQSILIRASRYKIWSSSMNASASFTLVLELHLLVEVNYVNQIGAYAEVQHPYRYSIRHNKKSRMRNIQRKNDMKVKRKTYRTEFQIANKYKFYFLFWFSSSSLTLLLCNSFYFTYESACSALPFLLREWYEGECESLWLMMAMQSEDLCFSDLCRVFCEVFVRERGEDLNAIVDT